MSFAAACAMLRFCSTACDSLASMVGSSARKRLSGRVAPPCTLFSLPSRSSSVRSRRMVDSLVFSASHSSCTVTVRLRFSCSMIRLKRSSASIGILSFGLILSLTVYDHLCVVLVDCIFIIANTAPKSITFSQFHSFPFTKICLEICAGSTKAGIQAFCANKKTAVRTNRTAAGEMAY